MLESLSKRILICTFFAALPLFYLSAIDKTMRPAKEDQDWRMLQQAENYFEDEKYGEAINLAEKAKDSRKQEVAWERYTIESSFKNSTVRKAGDSLSEVIDALKKRSSVSALNVISSAFDKKGESYFGNSVSKLNEYLSTADRYPEADYLIGKIYNLEGETELSLQYLQKALLNQDALDVPEQKYDIMYTLAEISYNSGNDDDYEKYLKLVLKDDANYKDPDNPNAPGTLMNAMIATIKNKRNPGTSYNDKEKTVDKFFKLYRSRNVISIKACSELAQYYDEKGRSNEALSCAALGTITAFSIICEKMAERDSLFEYKDLQTVLTECAKYDDIVAWGSDTGAWQLFYFLAKESSLEGSAEFAVELYTALSLSLPVEYWRVQAERALVK